MNTTVDPWVISMQIEFGYPTRLIADKAGLTKEMLVHHLSVQGHADIAIRLLRNG